MGKMYTLDKKLLIGSPEIQIGDKVYPVDDRNKTVRKVMKLSEDFKGKDDDELKGTPDQFETIDQILKLAFGDKYKDIEALELSFRAYLDLMDIVLDAMTNGDPEKYEEKKEEKVKEGSFPEIQA